MRRASKGFTLIELVAVIVILGVMALATTEYITFGTQVYVESTDRQRVLSQSRFFIERLSRELRNALPNSVRVTSNGRCIEFVPILSSGAYRTDASAKVAPITPAPQSDTLDVVSFNSGGLAAGDRLFIYPTRSQEIYTSSNLLNDKFAIIDKVDVALAPAIELTLQNAGSGSGDRFPEESPMARFYTADHSVNYCISNGSVFRFSKTNFDPSQSTAVPVGVTGVLMAEGLTNRSGNVPFQYASASHNRNSIVTLYLEFETAQAENMLFNHEVHIPNVP